MIEAKVNRPDLIRTCHDILTRIKRHQVLVGGGSGQRDRYEMRETHLYFDLGNALIAYFREWSVPNEKRVLVYADVWTQTKDLDLNEALLRWSVKIVEAFPDKTYFAEISELCRNSFGQIREVVSLLAKDNPLKVSESDLVRLKEFLKADHTYEAMQRMASELRSKYTASPEGFDLLALSEAFLQAELKVTSVVGAGPDERERLRTALGADSIKAIRYTLMLLGRESTLVEVRMKRPKDLRTAKRLPSDREDVIGRMHTGLVRFLDAEPRARDLLRQSIDPKDMGQMQRMLRAIESENEYEKYRKSDSVLRSLFAFTG